MHSCLLQWVGAGNKTHTKGFELFFIFLTRPAAQCWTQHMSHCTHQCLNEDEKDEEKKGSGGGGEQAG